MVGVFGTVSDLVPGGRAAARARVAPAWIRLAMTSSACQLFGGARYPYSQQIDSVKQQPFAQVRWQSYKSAVHRVVCNELWKMGCDFLLRNVCLEVEKVVGKNFGPDHIDTASGASAPPPVACARLQAAPPLSQVQAGTPPEFQYAA
jgi:hypothetical protein